MAKKVNVIKENNTQKSYIDVDDLMEYLSHKATEKTNMSCKEFVEYINKQLSTLKI